MQQTEQNTDSTPVGVFTALDPVSLDLPTVSTSTQQHLAEYPRTPEDVLPVWINGEDLNELDAD